MAGEPVQQTLLAKALARRGHEVSMVVADHGQADGMVCGGIQVFKAYRPDAGMPVLRFVHPRWTGLWSALMRADADLYYTSCAGMEAGLLALFCRHFGKRFVFRSASDSDCDKSRLLVRHARDRWLYAYGLRRADAILVQSASQAQTLLRSYGLASRVAGMLVEPPLTAPTHELDVLWVGNIRRVKRPDRVLWLAARLPQAAIPHGGRRIAGRGGAVCRRARRRGGIRQSDISRPPVVPRTPPTCTAARSCCSTHPTWKASRTPTCRPGSGACPWSR